ncbi:hypothetical protein WJT86_04540 [Microvirga sp. W0021]|uniref:Uncharacterized protein n=1 Tax=Hohaiivirga grylli TaxID=3133970 RepID=A0ABV0BHF4_9HYPH
MKTYVIVCAALAVLISGCSGSHSARRQISTNEMVEAFTTVIQKQGSSFSLDAAAKPKRTSIEMAKWLNNHPQPRVPAKANHPKGGPGCDSLKNPTRFINYIPRDVKAAIIISQSKPWAFARYDIDDRGKAYNIRPIKSSGYKEFADASLLTVALWSYAGQPEAYGLKNCVGLVQVAD